MLVKAGGSLTFATAIENDCSSNRFPSETRTTTAFAPTSEFVGVPVRRAVPSPLSIRVSQAGSVGAEYVNGLLSGSDDVRS